MTCIANPCCRASTFREVLQDLEDALAPAIGGGQQSGSGSPASVSLEELSAAKSSAPAPAPDRSPLSVPIAVVSGSDSYTGGGSAVQAESMAGSARVGSSELRSRLDQAAADPDTSGAPATPATVVER
eukprot:SAG31_NODE_11906_length_987_cov_1.365991_2_plen_128_part_00